jgi:hypothetical protein
MLAVLTVGSSDKPRLFRLSAVPADVGTSGRPNKKGLFGSGLLDSDLNCSKLMENLENKVWRDFLLG